MKGKLGLLALVLLAASYFLEKQFGVSPQPKQDTSVMTVTGKVTNKDTGNAIVGAAIEVQAAPAKTKTDGNGEYSISAKKGDLLVVSHPKYRRLTVEIAEDLQDVQLTPKD
ncbi:MAG: carboxypeptidase-like regulatory domain-containing protein [Prevotella sp.]|jgi:hypothetical protein|nr:carboxypeptidase-like regulatory domain-containing protein [Prevotella sp.]